MKFHVIFLISVISVFTHKLIAQSESKRMLFSVGTVYGSAIFPNEQYDLFHQINGRLRYSLSIHGMFPINEKINMQGGLQYSKINYDYNINGLKFEIDIINGTETSLISTYNYTLAEFPVSINFGMFNSSKNKIGFGCSVIKTLNNNINALLQYSDDTFEQLNSIENKIPDVNFSSFIQYNYFIKLSNDNYIYLNPVIKWYLKPNLPPISGIKAYYYSLALNIGLMIK